MTGWDQLQYWIFGSIRELIWMFGIFEEILLVELDKARSCKHPGNLLDTIAFWYGDIKDIR